MKFGDLLKTIGLVNKVPKNFTSAAGHNGQFADGSATNVDRIFHAFPPHRHYHNPYLGPTRIGATATGYHPMVYVDDDCNINTFIYKVDGTFV